MKSTKAKTISSKIEEWRIQHGCFSIGNIWTIYYCHRPLALAILGQSITVSTRNAKVLNSPLYKKYAISLLIAKTVQPCISRNLRGPRPMAP